MKITESVKSVFTEAHQSGSAGEMFSEAWPKSRARARLMRPAADAMSAIERRDKMLYFFEEGLREGHAGGNSEVAWHQSYSRQIAKDMEERAALKKKDAEALDAGRKESDRLRVKVAAFKAAQARGA